MPNTGLFKFKWLFVLKKKTNDAKQSKSKKRIKIFNRHRLKKLPVFLSLNVLCGVNGEVAAVVPTRPRSSVSLLPAVGSGFSSPGQD